MDTPPPPLPPANAQAIVDAEHLRLLGIFHYILGGLSILFGSLFLFHVFFGLAMLTHPRWLEDASSRHRPPVTLSTPGGADVSTPPAPDAETDSAPPTPPPFRHRSGPADDVQLPPVFGYMMAAMGGFAVLAGWTAGVLTIYSGLSIQRRRRRTFSLVVAGLNCLFFPFGTVLGVFTLVVLMRSSVIQLYSAMSPASLAGPSLPNA